MPRKSAEKHLLHGIAPLAVPLGFVLIWELWMRIFGATNVLLPTPTEVVLALAELVRTGELFEHIAASLYRVAAGYALSVAVGVPIGLAMGYSELSERFLSTTVNGLRPIPASAWIPLSIILMGIGDRPAIFLVFIGTVWVIVLNTSHGVKSVPKHLIWAAQTMGATSDTIFRKVIFPASLPATFTGMRVGVGVAFTCVIVAELIAVRSGLGYLITEARLLLRSDIVIAGMIAIGVVGFTLDALVRVIMSRTLRWQKGLVGE